MKSGLERILANIGLENIIETLSSDKITWADLHTLLLNIFEKKIEGINPAEIMKNYKENRFCELSLWLKNRLVTFYCFAEFIEPIVKEKILVES